MNVEEILYGTGLLGSLALIGFNMSNGTFDFWSFLGGCALIICGYGVYSFSRKGFNVLCE